MYYVCFESIGRVFGFKRLTGQITTEFQQIKKKFNESDFK